MTIRNTKDRGAKLFFLLRLPKLGAGGLLLLLTLSAHAQEAAGPPDKPILRIETGMHTAPIREISVDAANHYLLTASEDKTVRVWDARTGILVNILRPPIGEGNEGKTDSVAISPDGRTVACGGITSGKGQPENIYLFDRATGTLRKRITGLPNRVEHLVFSPDGRFLAATLYKGGIHLFGTADYTLAAKDEDYGNSSYSASFGSVGGMLRLVTSSDDGFLRLYYVDETNGTLHLRIKSKAPGGLAFGVAFSPDGGKIAVGFDGSTKVAVLSGHDLSSLSAPDTSGVSNGNLACVCWSTDGGYLYGTGTYQSNGRTIIRKWADGGKGAYADIAAAGNTIMSLQPRQDGGVFFGAADPAWGALDAQDHAATLGSAVIADFRDMGNNFRLAADGSAVAFSYQQWGKLSSVFSLADRKLTLGGDSAVLSGPVTAADGLDVQGWKYTPTPTLNGMALKLYDYEITRSLAISPDHASFLLGADWSLRLFGKDGTQKWMVDPPVAAWAVNISGDGKLAVAVFGDGTIRWFRMTDGQELLAFFPHADQKRWIAWTPSGQYDCSPGAEDLIGWHVNQGKDKEAKFYPVSRFFSQFYTPNLMARVIKGDTLPPPSVNLANGIKPPPSVQITSPAAGQAIDGDTVQVTVQATDQGGGVRDIRLFQNGTRISDDQKKIVEVPVRDARTLTRTFTVTLVPGQNVLRALAANTDQTDSDPAEVTLELKAAPSSADLYILAAGIEGYKNPQFALPYCKADAQAFAQAIAQRGKTIFGSIHTIILTDDQVTKGGLEAAFAHVKALAKPTDAFVFYYSGHGYELENDAVSPDDFYIVCQDVLRLDGADGIAVRGLSAQRLKELATGVPALKKLLVLDACQSGGAISAFSKGLAEETAIAQLAHSTGTVVLAASLKEQSASVFDVLKHSVFTYALLQGLAGDADPPPGDGKVTVKKLDAYLNDALPRLTQKYGGQTQYPESYAAGQDFPVGVH